MTDAVSNSRPEGQNAYCFGRNLVFFMYSARRHTAAPFESYAHLYDFTRYEPTL